MRDYSPLAEEAQDIAPVPGLAGSGVESQDPPSSVTVSVAQVVELNGSDVLSPEEEEFVVALISYGEAGAIRAYQEAFGGMAGSVAKNARTLLILPRIRRRLAAIREAMHNHMIITKESHLGELAVIRDTARITGNSKVALAAEVKRGEVAGFYDRVLDKDAGNTQPVIMVNIGGKVQPVESVVQVHHESVGRIPMPAAVVVPKTIP